jgi:hypothetical protein
MSIDVTVYPKDKNHRPMTYDYPAKKAVSMTALAPLYIPTAADRWMCRYSTAGVVTSLLCTGQHASTE